MHNRLYITFNKDLAKNSQEARDYAYNSLVDDSSFCGEGGRFNSPMADWFVIGGRWSGHLSEKALNIDFYKEVVKIIKPEHDIGFSTQEIKDNKSKIEALWRKLGGKGKSSFNRDRYVQTGSKDDAMIVDKVLYKKCLKEFEGFETDESFADLDWEEVSKDFIGKKWIVVIDYHS